MIDRKAALVTALVFDVTPAQFANVTGECKLFTERKARTIPGLIDTALLGNEERTRVLVLSQWESKDAWAKSRWDHEVGVVLSDLVEGSSAFDVGTFVPV
ncbi:MAG: antibiotic biosynthesis monooxygenase [Candidatus Tumulicola sp.]